MARDHQPAITERVREHWLEGRGQVPRLAPRAAAVLAQKDLVGAYGSRALGARVCDCPKPRRASARDNYLENLESRAMPGPPAVMGDRHGGAAIKHAVVLVDEVDVVA